MPVLQGNNSTIKPGTETQSGVVRLATATETLEGTATTIASTPAGVSLAIGAVVADAPTSLDTLEELAQALNNDPTFGVTTLARLDALEAGSSIDIQALQTELDATQVGAGLGTNGSYSADNTTTYLAQATSLKNADKKLDTQLASTQSNLQNLQGDVSNLSAGFSTLASDVADVVSDVSTLSATVSAHGDTLSEHTSDITSLESSLASISTNTSANSNAIALLDQALTQEIQDRQSAVAVVSGNLVDEIANREQADATLQTSINTKASSTDLTNLTTRVTTAESDIDTLQADVLGLTAGVDLRALEADLQNEITSRISADQALQASIDLKASSTDLTSLTTRVTTAESNIGTLQADVNLKADDADLTSLETRVTTAESNIGTLQINVNLKADDADLQDEIANRISADQALQTSINTKASSTDLTNLATRVTTAESDIDTLQADVINLTTGVDLRALETDLQNEITNRTNADNALDLRLDDVEAHHLHSNSYYANDNVTDIQTQVDAIGASQGNVVFVSSGSYGGSTLTINNKVNLGIICPNAGNTICELAGGRGLSIGGTSERVRITNLQIEGATSITGTKGRHIFQSVQFLGGLTINGVTDTSSTFMTFTDCEFASQNITISNITNCTIYFNRCSFSNVRVLPTNVASPFLIILSECSGLNSLQTNLTSGVAIVGRTGYSSGIVKVFSTSSNYISALGVETAFTGSYSELRDKPSLVTASTQLSDSSSLLRTSDKGVANGVAELDANGLIPNHHIPPLALSKPYVVNTLADRDALTGINTGDVAIVTSDPTASNNGNYIYDDTIPSWIALYNASSPISSVNGQIGTVTLYTGDISEGQGAQGEASKLYFTDSRALSASVTSSINTDDKAPTTQAVKLYVTGLTDALDTRLDSVESSITTFATTTYVDNGLSAKLNSSSYTASDVFNKVLSLDGSGSGLEADLLDGFHASSFVQTTGTQSIAGVKTFSDAPIVPDQNASDNSTKVANTKYVDSAISSIQATIGSSGTLIYKGTYDATANTPSLVSAKKGFFYQVSVGGTLAGVSLTTNDQVVFTSDVSNGVVQATDFIVIDNTESGVSSGGVAVANIGNGGTMQSGIYYLYDGSTNIAINVPARAVTQGTGAVTWLRIRGTGQVTLNASGVSGGEFIVYGDSGTVNGVKSVVLTKAGEYKLVCTRRTISGTVYAQWDVTVSNDRALRTADDLAEGTTNKYASSTNVRALLSATAPIVYTQATGVISTTLTQYTDTLAKTASVVNSMSGTQTDQAPSVSSVKAYYTAGTGISLTSGTIASTITQYTDTLAKTASVVNSMSGTQTDQAPSVSSVKAYYTAGTGISLSSGTIASTITQYTDEMAQDASATLLTSGTHTGISYSYNDASNKIDSTVSLASFSIDALSDVDTTTSTPTNGQALGWDSTTSKWKPTTITGSGGTFLVGTQTSSSTTISLLTAFDNGESEYVLIYTGTSTTTVSFPDASTGKKIIVKNFSNSIVNCTWDGSSTRFIYDGLTKVATVSMPAGYPGFSTTFIKVGNDWVVI